MAKSLEDALKQAQARAARAARAKPSTPSASGGKTSKAQQPWSDAIRDVVPIPPSQPPEQSKSSPKSASQRTTTHPPRAKRASSTPPPKYLHVRAPSATREVPADAAKLVVSPGAALVWKGGTAVTAAHLRRDERLGRKAQLVSAPTKGARELVLGFDFGTSSTKVVIGDRALNQAFAVPFRAAAGVESFLLPSRLHRDGGCWSLHGGNSSVGDLKLALMSAPDDLAARRHVVAFIALAIRSSRAWLFEAHADAYKASTLVWTLALGLPAAKAMDDELSRLYRCLGRAAWALAGAAGDVDDAACDSALVQAERDGGNSADVEVVALPEIAAQVYGFVNSSGFDPKAKNLYMLADVGAGTVDSCLFQVRRVRNRWVFDFYTAAVQPNGVVNAHRARVGWWQRHLRRSGSGAVLAEQFEAIRLETEHQAHIPASFRDYVTGVQIELSGRESGPDSHFIDKRVLAQLRGATLHRAVDGRLLNPDDLAGTPFFFCGGGARHPLYAAVPAALKKKINGFSYLVATRRELTLPSDLRADGVARTEYDRLSVAYGLSMMDSVAVSQVTSTVPKIAPQERGGWRDGYVSKDAV